MAKAIRPGKSLLAHSQAHIHHIVGTGEAFWLMNTTGAPDLLSPKYASILYGLIGLGIGLGAAIAGEILGKFVPFLKNRGFGIGAAAAITPVAAFLLRYQLNKVAYAEQGVPLSTMGMILAVLLVIDLFLIFGVPSIFKDKAPKAGLLAGLWAVLTLAMAGVWISGSSSDDPAAVAHGKRIPSELSDKPIIFDGGHPTGRPCRRIWKARYSNPTHGFSPKRRDCI